MITCDDVHDAVGPPPGRSKKANEERDVGFILCVLFFLAVGTFFGIG